MQKRNKYFKTSQHRHQLVITIYENGILEQNSVSIASAFAIDSQSNDTLNIWAHTQFPLNIIVSFESHMYLTIVSF